MPASRRSSTRPAESSASFWCAKATRFREGDLLIRLDETVTRANLQVIVRQLDELVGRKARLEAERDGKDGDRHAARIDRAGSSDPEVARIVAAEQKLFQARRSAREGQRAQLTKRIAQLQNEIRGTAVAAGRKCAARRRSSPRS